MRNNNEGEYWSSLYEEEYIELPVITLKEYDRLSKNTISFDLCEKRSIAALDDAMIGNQAFFVRTQESEDVDSMSVGAVARIVCFKKLPGVPHRVVVEALCEGKVESVLLNEPFLKCRIKTIVESAGNTESGTDTEL